MHKPSLFFSYLSPIFFSTYCNLKDELEDNANFSGEPAKHYHTFCSFWL